MPPPSAVAGKLLSSLTITDSSTCPSSSAFVIPCDKINKAQYSLDSLLAARAFAQTNSKRAWMEIDSIFASQAASGFIPKLRFVSNYSDSYLFNTIFPGPSSPFYSPMSSGHGSYAPAHCSYNSSLTISALPLHAAVILETFFISGRTSSDLNNLEAFFPKLITFHTWLHQFRTYGNIVHPWESSLPTNSPVWNGTVMDNLKGEQHQTPCETTIHGCIHY